DPDHTLRIKKNIRDMLVFSEQDVIKDPPFSKLDLIVCRNLLIYLGLELQKKLIPLFHYALKPGGFLFLGTSEGIGDFGELFTVVDRKSKLYQRNEHFRGAERDAAARLLPPSTGLDVAATRIGKRPAPPQKPPLREVTEQALLQQIAPASLLVNRDGDILYQHGRTGMYLEPAPGESGVNNILKMAREGLRRDLAMALHKSAATRVRVQCGGLRIKTNGHFTFVNLTVCPVLAGTAGEPASPGTESDMYLVILDEAPAAAAEAAPPAAAPAGAAAANGAASAGLSEIEGTIAALKEDLRARDEYLQSAHEELESSNEELKSSNEEMQSVNEELQSTNEELETSKEELQSVNEEIGTVNTELQTKVADLSRANNDMSNLLAGTGIGTVFVDFQLRILRFTPAASEFINLIAGDVGRPVAHVASNLVAYDRLVKDVQAVLSTLIPKEVNVQTTEGKWSTMRILPYRTLDNVIEGAVITFVDITETVKTREALHKANDLARLAVVLRDAHDAITVQDLEGRILAWNPGAMRLYGWSEAEALLMNVRDRIPPELRGRALATLEQLSRAETIEPYRTQRITKQGAVMAVSIVSTALVNEAGEVYAIATTERGLGSEPR
ncbi:MAG: PAS domain-containing protein, partial [Ramlibacter sp.]